MDRAGDLPAVTQTFLDYRKALETQLAKRDPALVPKLKPVLDKEFSQDALRARAACGFAAIAAKGGAVRAIEAWSKSPEMHAVNVSIWNRAPVPSEDDPVPNTAKRIDRMRDIYTAMALEQVAVNRIAGLGPEPAALVAALDAAVLSLPAAAPKERIDRQTVLLDKWLIPALAKTSDKDIETFMDFAESPTGADYYVALAAAYDFRNGDWYSQLYQALREAAAPGELPGGAPGGKDAVIAQARQLLVNVGTPAAAAQALAMLQEVERIDPRNALVRRLVGEAAIKSTPPVPLAQDQLRAVIDAPSYYIADQELAKSLELAPDDADALMWLGRLRYLQGRDAEAGPLFQRAAEINEEHPYLNLFNADLIYETGDYTKAMRYYQAALAKPEGLPFVYDTTMSHLMSAMRRANRASDFPRVADAFLAQHPQYWNVRLDYADFLMATPGIKSDRIVAVVDPVPDTWLPARKFAVLSAALVRKSTERLDKKTGAPVGDSQAAMKRAIALNPDPYTLAEAICRAGADAKIAQMYVDASGKAKATSTALTVCALRWQRIDILRVVSPGGDPIVLSSPQPSLLGDTPLCYAAATKNVKGFVALAKLQVNPGQRCNDGNSVSERLSRLAYGGDPSIAQMQSVLQRFYRKP
ncbi:MAG: tetratricopeptide repeat protein [Lysobacteraceae bacterium]